MRRRFYLLLILLSAIGNVLLDQLPAPDVDTRLRNMFNAMNRSVDPCDNFYEYMCGNWLAHNPIPLDTEAWSEIGKLQQRTKERLREILEGKDQLSDIEQTKLARAYYRSCIDDEAREAKSLQPITEILEKNGGWPILTRNWTSTSTYDTWQTIHATYQRLYEVGAFFNVILNADYDNSSRIDIVINQNIEYPLLNIMMNEQVTMYQIVYTNAINDIIVEFVKDSGRNTTREVLKEIAELLFFQSSLQLTRQIYDVDSSSEMDYDRMTIKELQNYYDNGQPPNPTSHINFLSNIRTIFEEVSEKINDDTVVEVHRKYELLSLKNFLNTESPRMAVNYVHWNFVANFLPYTNRKMREFLHRLRSVHHKSIQEKPRWETCIDEMQLKQALSYSFVEKYSNNAVIGKATDMALRMLLVIAKRIRQSRNLSDQGKDYVLRKLNGLKLIIGYPQWYSNESAITQYYDGLTVGPDYFQNRLNYHLYDRKKNVPRFGEHFDKYSWFESSTTVNAFYYPQTNTIVLPLAQFLDTFTGTTVPHFMAYAHIGFVLGHEMTHTITGETDLIYDENGNKLYTPVNTTTDEGERNSVCFEKKFNKYILHEVKETNETLYLNGALTKLENMADALGFDVARDAYLSATGEINQPVVQLPHELANFTEEQLFFMSLASQWCEAIRPEIQRLALNIDVHTPARYRVDGTLSNLDAFSRAFNCPVTSLMSSADKCQTL